MAFQEKSAWVMLLALLVSALFYVSIVAAMSEGLGHLASPGLSTLVGYTIVLVAICAIGHIVIAIFAVKDADAPLDEREKIIVQRAAHLSSYVLGAGVIMALILFLFFKNGNLLFYAVFMSLILAQIVEYTLHIFFYRSTFY